MSNEFERVKAVQWDVVRDPSHYELTVLEYPFGRRLSYRPKEQEVYEDLQCSRGLHVHEANSLEEISISSPIQPSDMLRISELRHYPQVFSKEKDLFEIGFRTTKILDYYRPNFREVRGCDVVDINVECAARQGYKVEKCDFNEPSQLNLTDVQLVVSYHVFEHLYDPLKSIVKLYEKMDSGAFLHVEIPVEPGMPRIRYAHVYSFHADDIQKMVELAGFKVTYTSSTPYEGGPDVERLLCQK